MDRCQVLIFFTLFQVRLILMILSNRLISLRIAFITMVRPNKNHVSFSSRQKVGQAGKDFLFIQSYHSFLHCGLNKSWVLIVCHGWELEHQPTQLCQKVAISAVSLLPVTDQKIPQLSRSKQRCILFASANKVITIFKRRYVIILIKLCLLPTRKCEYVGNQFDFATCKAQWVFYAISVSYAISVQLHQG